MSGWLRRNSLSIVSFGLFAVFLVGQSLAGWHTYDEQQLAHHEHTVGLGTYLTTGHFVEPPSRTGRASSFRWPRTFLLTAWLVQKGSAESKPLGIALAVLFVLSFLLHALGGAPRIQRGAGRSRPAPGEHG